ncbi:ABC transporter ATP-binding protein [Hominisplanchenecus murintestinalis]|uniref:ABC transporter ATP-binding protein n=1 Tax=Hominisplanchenecus murintestinalis TaxID=2941517 RepID=A0AC61QZ51_9FIRM|nr:ABC transporter ATP-binding protein [Hominisplanchenecus murintestinalis]TGX98652.1 ABC transporter ATP-binding protein [Hominisplanchenecus murintestinalis]
MNEKKERSIKNREIYRRILRLIQPYRHLLILSLIFAVVSVVLTLYAPVLTGRGIDLVIGKGNVDFDGLRPILVRFALVVAATALAQWLMNLCNNKITYHVVKDIRTQAFEHLEELPLRYIDSLQYGEIISRVVADVDQFSDGLLMGFSQLFTGIITIFGTLGFMLGINVAITVFVVVMTPMSLFVASFIARRTFSMFRAQSEARAAMTGLVDEMVGNQKIVKAFSYEKEAEQRFQDINEKLRTSSLKAIFFSSLTNPSTRFVNNLVSTGVAIIGAVMAIRGRLTVGQLSCFVSYANQYTKPFNEISGVATEFQNAVVCAGRVFDLIDETPQAPDAPDALALTPERVDGSVELENVAFSYKKNAPLIQNLSLNVKPGQRIAIVGPTGCGKTTMINLLMRFYDVDAGEIRVSGYPIKSLTRDSLRRNYGMVLQETWLKAGTVAENIAYGKLDASREEIIQAAKEAHAHGFISRMPDGYDTQISESGGNLSQGQKQLLCIARVMLCLPPMLILDEATSSIDTRTEIRIQKAFARMMQGRTSFIVAHRLSTIKEADVILVMKDGHIIEQGNHETLLAEGGFYAELYNSQFARSV